MKMYLALGKSPEYVDSIFIQVDKNRSITLFRREGDEFWNLCIEENTCSLADWKKGWKVREIKNFSDIAYLED